MSQQNQQANTSMQAVAPPKRKRGRPRKDESQAQGEKSFPKPPAAPPAPIKLQVANSTANPISDGMKGKEHVQVDTSDDNTEDEMVGQVVTGVLESSFDAGYFLTVKIGDTDTYLRGVVFEEGKYVPVTPENDIAPGLKMHKRKEVPIPDLNFPTKQAKGTSSKSAQDDRQTVQLDKQAASNQTVGPEPHLAMLSASASTAIPSASTAIPSASNATPSECTALPSAPTAPSADEFLKNNTDASQKGNINPGNNATSEALSQLDQDQQKNESPEKVLCNSEASPPEEGLKPNADADADVTAELASDLELASEDKQKNSLPEQEGPVEKDGMGTTTEEVKGEVPESELELSVQPVDKENEGVTEKDASTGLEGPKTGDDPLPTTEPAGSLQGKPTSPRDKEAQEMLEESPAKKMKTDLVLGFESESTGSAAHVSQENATLEMDCNSANTSVHEEPALTPDDAAVHLAKETAVLQLVDSLAKTALPVELTPSTAEETPRCHGLELDVGNVVDNGSMGPGKVGGPMDSE